MPDMIKSPSTGYTAEVSKNNQLFVKAESESIQHTQSFFFEQAYQVKTTMSLIAGTLKIFHVKNLSSSKDIVVTYMRHQVIGSSGGTSFPNSSNYMTIGFDPVYASGGDVLTPINMNNGSGNEAEVICYGNNPTTTGTLRAFDDWYTKSDGDMNTWNKEGSLIIQPNKTMELRYITDQTSGLLFFRMSFLMKEI